MFDKTWLKEQQSICHICSTSLSFCPTGLSKISCRIKFVKNVFAFLISNRLLFGKQNYQKMTTSTTTSATSTPTAATTHQQQHHLHEQQQQ